jgi:hypothetical protein
VRVPRPRPAEEGIDRRLYPPAARPFVWCAAPADVPPGRFVHAVDKGRMFLAAAGGLPIGWGRAEELDGPAFDKTIPAWWEVELEPVPGLPADLFGGAWHATAMVQLARDCGQDVRPRRAMTWEHRGAYFGASGKGGHGFVKRVGDALDALAGDELARAAMKRLYTAALGGRLLAEGGPLGAVPDWSGQLVSRANANLMRNALEVLGAGGPAPVAIHVDALCYVDDEPDAGRAIPPGLRTGTGPGQFRPVGVGTARLDHQDVQEALAARSAPRLVECVRNGTGLDDQAED